MKGFKQGYLLQHVDLSHAIFICYCSIVWPLFDFKIFLLPLSSIFHLPTFYFILWPFHIHSIFHLPFSIHTSFHYPLTSIFHFSSLCSFVLFLLLLFHHLSIIPHLPSLTLTTWHFILCDSASHILPTFSILHHSPYCSEPCSMNFFQLQASNGPSAWE